MAESGAQAFLAAHYGARATEPRLLGAGDWSQAFAFTLDGQDAVIRFGRHVWAQHGGTPVDTEHRLLTYLVHIGLDAMCYSAFKRRWDDLARTADQVIELARMS